MIVPGLGPMSIQRVTMQCGYSVMTMGRWALEAGDVLGCDACHVANETIAKARMATLAEQEELTNVECV